MKRAFWNCLVSGVCVTFTGIAHAQISEEDASAPPDDALDGSASTSAEEAPAADASTHPQESSESGADVAAADPDGLRFRFGVSGGAGPLIADGISFTYVGADARFGVQINDLVGV